MQPTGSSSPLQRNLRRPAVVRLTHFRCASRAARSTELRSGAHQRYPSPSVMHVFTPIWNTCCDIVCRINHRDPLCISHHTVCAARCSGDFSQVKSSKYIMGLPGLPERIIAASLADNITEAERAIAAAPGMYGRIWYGQGLAFDEAYQILQELHRVLHSPSVRHTHVLNGCGCRVHAPV